MTRGWRRHVIVLLVPFIVNFSISMLIGFYAAEKVLSRGGKPEEIWVEAIRISFTYNFYWSILQIAFGIYAIRIMGGWSWVKEQYTFKMFRERLLKNIGIIVGLAVFSWILFGIEHYINTLIYGSKYMEIWMDVASSLPLFSKIYLVGIAPFTAGIFEEIIWRGYGLTKLEESLGWRKAVVIQAITFGLWHGLSLHTLITFLMGLVFGIIYVRERKLTSLTISHILIDIVGFSLAFLR